MKIFQPEHRVDRTLLLPHKDADPDFKMDGLRTSASSSRPIVMDFGAGGVSVGTMMEFADRLCEILNLRVAYASGGSTGTFVAVAEVLGLEIGTKREWVRRMPLEALSQRKHGTKAIIDGIRRGGFIDAPSIIQQHVEVLLDEVSREQHRDVRTFAATRISPNDRHYIDGFDHRLQIGVQIGNQKGMRHPVEHLTPEQHRTLVHKIAETIGIDVERNLLRLRFPRIRQLSLPADAAQLGFGNPNSIRIADTAAPAIARTPFLTAVELVNQQTGDVYALFDSASGVDLTFHPDVRMRDMNWQRLSRTFVGPGADTLPYPPIAIRMGNRGSTTGTVTYEGNPELGIPPCLVITLPSTFSAMDFTPSLHQLDQSMSWGGKIAEAVLSQGQTNAIETFLDNYLELAWRYDSARNEILHNPQSKQERRGWYEAIYQLGMRFVAPIPEQPAPGSMDFADSSLGH